MIYCKDCGMILTFTDLALTDELLSKPTCNNCNSTNLEDTESNEDEEE
ncbi:hypothetical protein [Limnoraphis robusta]|nr:hypothetical protein [Limnoraphis robusta]MEA5498015.1 hypothetical protein [Limnoraphis robusta BA-68 BA1]